MARHRVCSAFPLSNKSGGITGFIAPYDSSVFDAQLAADGDKISYQCGIN